MKQEFKMTQEEMDDIIAMNKNKMPVLKIGNVVTGMDLQERINNYWVGLGNKYGFKPMSVEKSSKGKLYFLAETKPIVKPKTALENALDKYDTLQKIVDQLEKAGYKNEVGGDIKLNVAFMKLKLMAAKKQ
jgi:hypothetical protein